MEKEPQEPKECTKESTRARVRPLAEHKEQEKVKDGSNNNTKRNRPTKEKEKASARVRTPSSFATSVAWKGTTPRTAELECTISMMHQPINLILQRNGTQTQDKHTPQTGGTRITAPQASAAQQQGIQHVQHIIQQQPAQQQGQSVSGLLIAMTAYTDSVGDVRRQHDIVDLMIDVEQLHMFAHSGLHQGFNYMNPKGRRATVKDSDQHTD